MSLLILKLSPSASSTISCSPLSSVFDNINPSLWNNPLGPCNFDRYTHPRLSPSSVLSMDLTPRLTQYYLHLHPLPVSSPSHYDLSYEIILNLHKIKEYIDSLFGYYYPFTVKVPSKLNTYAVTLIIEHR